MVNKHYTNAQLCTEPFPSVISLPSPMKALKFCRGGKKKVKLVQLPQLPSGWPGFEFCSGRLCRPIFFH